MAFEEPIPTDLARRVAEEVRTHPRRSALAALAFDVLSRQAEGRTLYGGREYVVARAEAHGVTRDDGSIGGVQVLEVLEKGPSSTRERAIVAALAIIGLAEELADGSSREVLDRFVRHADWLELDSPYPVYRFLELLGSSERSLLHATLAKGLLAERRTDGAGRARAALRIHALSIDPSARDTLRRVAAEAEDPFLRSLAAGVLDDRGPTGGGPNSPRVTGSLGRTPRTGLRDALWIASGLALLSFLVTAGLRLFGVRREGEVEIVPLGLKLRSRIRVFGRSVREREEVFGWSGVTSVGRLVRFPALPLLVGACALALGVLVGGSFFVDGVRTGATELLLAGALVVFAGAAADLVFSVFWPAREGKVAIELLVRPRRAFRLRQVARDDAERFLDAVEQRRND